MNITKIQFIKRIREIAHHKERLAYLQSKKYVKPSLADIPDVHLQELNKKK